MKFFCVTSKPSLKNITELSPADVNKSREEGTEQRVEIDPEFLENEELFSSDVHKDFAKLPNGNYNKDNSLQLIDTIKEKLMQNADSTYTHYQITHVCAKKVTYQNGNLVLKYIFAKTYMGRGKYMEEEYLGPIPYG